MKSFLFCSFFVFFFCFFCFFLFFFLTIKWSITSQRFKKEHVAKSRGHLYHVNKNEWIALTRRGWNVLRAWAVTRVLCTSASICLCPSPSGPASFSLGFYVCTAADVRQTSFRTSAWPTLFLPTDHHNPLSFSFSFSPGMVAEERRKKYGNNINC